MTSFHLHIACKWNCLQNNTPHIIFSGDSPWNLRFRWSLIFEIKVSGTYGLRFPGIRKPKNPHKLWGSFDEPRWNKTTIFFFIRYFFSILHTLGTRIYKSYYHCITWHINSEHHNKTSMSYNNPTRRFECLCLEYAFCRQRGLRLRSLFELCSFYEWNLTSLFLGQYIFAWWHSSVLHFPKNFFLFKLLWRKWVSG